MALRRPTVSHASQRGAALLIFALLLIIGLLGTFLSRINSVTLGTQRDQISSDSLAQAKEALIGFAATYRDTRPDQVFGYLPCPDTDNNGESDSCGLKDVSLVGRLPWKTLGLPPLRDGSGECLWYAVSGHAKDDPKTDAFNWDTLGQFIVKDAGGTMLAGTTAHDYPLAVIFAAGAPLAGKSRPSAGTSECGGSNTVSDYLEGIGALGTGNTTLTVANADSQHAGTNNDQGLWISSKDIFDRIKKRSDFKTDVESLLNDITLCLNARPPASLPDTSAINKGVGDYPTPGLDTNINDVLTLCKPAALQKQNVMINLQDNLLYIKQGAVSSLNGDTDCNAMLFFSGTRQGLQSRTTPTEQAIIANYLEGANLDLFPIGGSYSTPLSFNHASSSTDIARCIKGLPAGATQKSFAADFGTFTTAGPSGGAAVTPDAATQTVAITHTGSSGNGCFWLPSLIPLAGKTLRAYYEFQFLQADDFALGGTGQDRGNGFTLQLLSGDMGAPNVCGSATNMGIVKPLDGWLYSFIVETDVHKKAGAGDPAGNHTAIMLNGNTNHTPSGGTPSASCDGTTNGCLHSPANKFEEGDATDNNPQPSAHNQRLEIHTGCNATCSSCTPATHLAPNTYAKISVWVDCVDCIDVGADFSGSELITSTENRDFSALGSWSGSNWAIAGGAFAHTVGANSATLPNSALSSPPVATSIYSVKATVITSDPGSLDLTFGGTSSGAIPLMTGSAILNIQLKAVSTAALSITPDATWTGTIDNVSITPWNTPTVQRCLDLSTPAPNLNVLNSVYLGFTAGFRGTPETIQGVTFSNFSVRSD